MSMLKSIGQLTVILLFISFFLTLNGCISSTEDPEIFVPPLSSKINVDGTRQDWSDLSTSLVFEVSATADTSAGYDLIKVRQWISPLKIYFALEFADDYFLGLNSSSSNGPYSFYIYFALTGLNTTINDDSNPANFLGIINHLGEFHLYPLDDQGLPLFSGNEDRARFNSFEYAAGEIVEFSFSIHDFILFQDRVGQFADRIGIYRILIVDNQKQLIDSAPDYFGQVPLGDEVQL